MGRTSIVVNQGTIFDFKYISLFITFIIIFSFLSGDITKKLFHYFFLIFWLLVQENMTILLLKSSVQNQTISIFMIQFLLTLLSLLLILGLRYFEIDNLIGLNKIEYMILSITPFLSILLLLQDIERVVSKAIILDNGLLIINIVIIVLYNYLSEKNLKLSKIQITAEEDVAVKEIINQEKELSVLRHDLKNIVSSIDFYADHQDYENIKSITKSLLGQSALNRKITGCVPLDAVLNQKILKMKKDSIKYHLDFQIPYNLNLHEIAVDICAILGNILDNSIEEVERNNLQESIHIILRFKKGQLVFKVDNPMKEESIEVKYDGMLSVKSSHRYGIGLKSIYDRTIRLGGHLNVEASNYHFTVLVMIPL